jgi:hypothetical protein
MRRALLVLLLVGATVRAAPDAIAPDATATHADDPSAALLAQVDHVVLDVAHLRGLRKRRPIAHELVSIDDLRKRLADSAAQDKNASQLAAEAMGLERWGVLPLGTDYSGLLVDVLTEQIAGYYDHDAHKLYIAQRDPAEAGAPAGSDASDATDWGDMLLAHEIDHALCDQAFDLGKLMKLPDDEGDAQAARRALVEGDGMALMIEYLLAHHGKAPPWTDPDLAQMLMHSMDADGPAGAKLGTAPLWVREELLFPYRAGLEFVASIRKRHPWSSVDAVYRRPPRSSEQILHPELYDADERPVPVTAKTPPSLSDFRTVWTDVWGEEKWATFLRAHGVDDRIAYDAAAGWGGDRVAVYAREGDDDPTHAIGVARTAWDTEVDAQEAAEALVRALDGFDGVGSATAERTDDGGRWLGGGRASWVERRGREVVIVVGAPAPLAAALRAEVWTSWKAKLPREK